VAPYLVQLTEKEIKMLLVAIRQVDHTFAIAEAQSAASGEQLAEEYDGVREAYEELHRKLAAVAGTDAGKPRIVK